MNYFGKQAADTKLYILEHGDKSQVQLIKTDRIAELILTHDFVRMATDDMPVFKLKDTKE